MHITHESAELLVIHSPAKGARRLGSIFLIIGGVLDLIALGIIGPNLLFGDVGSAVGGAVTFGLFGAVLTIGGIVAWVRAQDTDYSFDVKAQELVICNRRGQTTIPFADIVSSEVSVSAGDEGPDTYGLRIVLRSAPEKSQDRAWVITRGGDLGLKLRGIHFCVEMCPLLRPDAEAANAKLSDRINQFLRAH